MGKEVWEKKQGPAQLSPLSCTLRSLGRASTRARGAGAGPEGRLPVESAAFLPNLCANCLQARLNPPCLRLLLTAHPVPSWHRAPLARWPQAERRGGAGGTAQSTPGTLSPRQHRSSKSTLHLGQERDVQGPVFCRAPRGGGCGQLTHECAPSLCVCARVSQLLWDLPHANMQPSKMGARSPALRPDPGAPGQCPLHACLPQGGGHGAGQSTRPPA